MTLDCPRTDCDGLLEVETRYYPASPMGREDPGSPAEVECEQTRPCSVCHVEGEDYTEEEWDRVTDAALWALQDGADR